MNYLINILLTSLLIFSSQLFALDEQKKNSSIYEKISSTLSNTVWGAPIDTTGFPEAKTGDDRAGYRSDVSSVSQKFYNDMKKKLSRGEKLNFAERVTVNFFIATRRWPDAPKIDSGDQFTQEWVEKHFSSNRDFIAAELASCMQSFRGRNDNDSYLSPDSDLEKFRQYYYNIAPKERSTLMNTMMSWYRSQGYDMRNDAAKKASKENDKIVLEKRKDKIKAILTKHQKQLKKDNISDATRLFHCLCRSSGGSMGGYYSPGKGGPCLAVGVFNSWQAGMPSSKKVVLPCLNQIDYDNYQKSLKIFEEMHQHDKNIEQQREEMQRKQEAKLEAKYPNALQNIQKENAASVQEQFQEVKQLLQKEKTFVKAAQLFTRIKDLLYIDDKRTISKELVKKLSNYSSLKIHKGNMKEAIDILNVTQRVTQDGSFEKEQIQRQIANYEAWQEKWDSVKEEIFPKIYEDLKQNRVISAKAKMPQADPLRLGAPWSSQGHASTHSPEYLSLKEVLAYKENEYRETYISTKADAKKMMNTREPQSAINSLTDYLDSWEHSSYAKGQLEKMLSQAQGLLKHAIKAEKSGDLYSAKSDYASALRQYRSSLSTRNSAIVQRKLDKLYKNHDIALKYKAAADETMKDGHFTRKELLKAIEQYKKSLSYWPDKNLQAQLDRILEALRRDDRKVELNRKIAKLEREKAQQEEEQMASAGLDFGNQFGSRESRRSEKVEEKQMRDAYTDIYERGNDQEEMLERLKKNLEKVKAANPVNTKPVSSTWIPPKIPKSSPAPNAPQSSPKTAGTVSQTPTLTGIAKNATTTSQTTQGKAKSTNTVSNTTLVGTLRGTWKETQTNFSASGTFIMNLLANGSVKFQTFGDDEDIYHGTVNSSGSINFKMKGDDGEVFYIKGNVKKDTHGKLIGNGSWSFNDGTHGIWTSNTTEISKPKASSLANTGWDGLYTGSYTDKHLNTRDERCQNHSGKLSIVVKGNRFSGDGSGTITKKGSGSNGYLNGSFNNGYKANGSYIVFNNTITGFISGPAHCTAGIDLRKR